MNPSAVLFLPAEHLSTMLAVPTIVQPAYRRHDDAQVQGSLSYAQSRSIRIVNQLAGDTGLRACRIKVIEHFSKVVFQSRRIVVTPRRHALTLVAQEVAGPLMATNNLIAQGEHTVHGEAVGS